MHLPLGNEGFVRLFVSSKPTSYSSSDAIAEKARRRLPVDLLRTTAACWSAGLKCMHVPLARLSARAPSRCTRALSAFKEAIRIAWRTQITHEYPVAPVWFFRWNPQSVRWKCNDTISGIWFQNKGPPYMWFQWERFCGGIIKRWATACGGLLKQTKKEENIKHSRNPIHVLILSTCYWDRYFIFTFWCHVWLLK